MQIRRKETVSYKATLMELFSADCTASFSFTWQTVGNSLIWEYWGQSCVQQWNYISQPGGCLILLLNACVEFKEFLCPVLLKLGIEINVMSTILIHFFNFRILHCTGIFDFLYHIHLCICYVIQYPVFCYWILNFILFRELLYAAFWVTQDTV